MLTLTKQILTDTMEDIKYERIGRIPYRTYYILEEATQDNKKVFKLTISDGYFNRPFILPETVDYAQVTLRNVLEQYWEEAEWEILNFHENNTSI